MKEEWKQIFKSNWLRIVMAAIMIIPSVYAGVFLGSMWDPYGKADQIPVAVVNEDRPVTFQSAKMHIGKDLADNLKDNQSMKFEFTSAKKAKKGLKNGDYYMVITIPKNFSKNATTLLNENPKKMVLKYETNPGTNYIASKMDETVINKIKASVSATVTHTYADTLFDQVGTLSKGLKDASNGSAKLNTGVDQLVIGNAAIHDNLKVLSASTLTFRDGAQTLENGLMLYTEGVDEVYSGTKLLNEKSSGLNGGISKLGTGITNANNGSQNLLNGLQLTSGKLKAQMTPEKLQALQTLQNLNNETAAKLKAELIDPQLIANSNAANALTAMDQNNLTTDQKKAIQAAADTLSANNTSLSTLLGTMDNMNKQNYATIGEFSANLQALQKVLDDPDPTQGLIAGAEKLNTGLSKMNASVNGDEGLAAGLAQYTAGVRKLNQGAAALTNTNKTLLNGMAQLNGGSSAISSGAFQLASGSSTMGSGLTTLKNGTDELSKKLGDGAAKSQMNISDETMKMMAEPLTTKHSEMYEVKNNGHAMAPYMMSVGMYVACMAFTLMYPLMKNGSEKKSGFKLWLNKASVMFTVSTIQAVLMIAALMGVNGMQPANVAATFLMAILISAAFMSMIVFFNITCGKIGAFLVLIFMVFQLGGAAGTYPIETSNAFYLAIHPFMPFTYSVHAFRQTLAMSGNVGSDALIFAAMIIVFSALSILFYKWKVTLSDEQFEQTRLAQYH